LVGDFQPQGTLETTLVEDLAVQYWRKRRLFQADSAEITEKVKFMVTDSLANQYSEAWDHSRAALTVGGLLKYPNNPLILREAKALLGQLRRIVMESGFNDHFQLLERLYGRDESGQMPHGLCVTFQLCAANARARAGSADKSEEANDKQKMVALIDSEIQRVTKLEENLINEIAVRNTYRLSAALIPGQEGSDRLLRYETHFSREIDRILKRLERLQRLRKGQPLPPEVGVNINH
jgi:hypothetical protein